MKQMNIGIFGFGCVGQGLFYALQHSAGFTATIKKIVVKSKDKRRSIDANFFSFDKDDILEDKSINVVVELIDDAEAAYKIVKQAILLGKNVVTANKKMLALHLKELLDLAEKHQVSLLYEASACGSIPIIRTLEEYFDNEPLTSIKGVFNGTTNYMLTAISKNGISYAQALSEAQASGFAESDPTSDVEGFDALYKTVIIALHGFGIVLNIENLLRVGINNLKLEDVDFAKKSSYEIKLIPTIKKVAEGTIAAFVLPCFVKIESHLQKIENEFNGVLVEGLFSGEQFFLGRGAGSFPTGAAVLSDVSALSYGYNYEYKKLKQQKKLIFTNDITIRIYISSKSESDIKDFQFDDIEIEKFKNEYSYRVGTIKIAHLLSQMAIITAGKVFLATFED